MNFSLWQCIVKRLFGPISSWLCFEKDKKSEFKESNWNTIQEKYSEYNLVDTCSTN